MIKINFLLLTVLFYFFASVSLNAGDYEKAFEALKEEKYEEASYYLSYFASNGDSVAQYNMGLLYRDGLGVEKNIEVALSWLNLAAQQKHMLANFAVAKILEKNRNLGSRDADQLNYLKEAAFLGHAIAPLEVGNFYYSRQETPHDVVRAIVWWTLSSERNAPGALENISRVLPSLNQKQLNEISIKFAECDNQTLRDCFSNF